MPIVPNKHPMPLQRPDLRCHNFDEVALGYDEKTAIEEAKRCLNCKNRPCVSGCPVNIDIPDFIKEVSLGNFLEAYKIINKKSSLPAICGRVCPQETQCEHNCTLGIKFEAVGIGYLERFVADYYHKHYQDEEDKIKTNGIKVAVIGSGPSGLSCASSLAKMGYQVTIYEALHKAGGVLTYGIPEFRLPKSIVDLEINNLKKLGVKIETNVIIGKTLTVDELFEMDYKAIYISTGAGLPNFMNIKGEELKGVYSANEFLTRINLMGAYKNDSNTPIYAKGNVVVVGGGNVAMDAARTALRLGADKVYIVYRRSIDELPARREEVIHAKEEGIIFNLLTNPVEIIANDDPNSEKKGFVKQIKCVKMELGEADETGRRSPVEIKGSEFSIDADIVIMAIGTSPNPLIKNTTSGLEVNRRGCIVIDDNMQTSKDSVYAGGDAVTGAATVISAMGAGKKAAKAIDLKLKK